MLNILVIISRKSGGKQQLSKTERRVPCEENKKILKFVISIFILLT